MALSDSRPDRHPKDAADGATVARIGPPPITRITFPTCRAHYPADRNGCVCRLLPHPARPSPYSRRVGIRDFTFEACSGFTHITARWIAQPPKAAFVTRLRPGRLPDQAARQLPGLTDNCLGGFFLHWCYAPSGRTGICRFGEERDEAQVDGGGRTVDPRDTRRPIRLQHRDDPILRANWHPAATATQPGRTPSLWAHPRQEIELRPA